MDEVHPPSPGDIDDQARELHGQQQALAAHIRDPLHVPPPPGMDPRAVRVYRELFRNNIDGMLGNAFPVIQGLLAGARWHELVGGFLRDHDSRTPLFTELPQEFLRYLQSRMDVGDPPWLAELAHYEWVELALQISEACVPAEGIDADGDLLAGVPVVSPLAWPLAYAWPVHRLGPQHLPIDPPALPTLLLLRRESGGEVSFHELSPLAFRLLQRIETEPHLTGAAQLQALAAEAAADDIAPFLRAGEAMLQHFRADGTLLGTRIG
jgi:uncharacterized protein